MAFAAGIPDRKTSEQSRQTADCIQRKLFLDAWDFRYGEGSSVTNTICIATASHDIPTETFIRTHIDCLPFHKLVLTGSDLTKLSDGSSVTDRSAVRKRVHGLLDRFGRFNYEEFRAARLAQFFKEKKVSAVLCEYGMAACLMTDACNQADIPLIAHFHGYDAYNEEVIEQHLDDYKRLFESTADIVGVSKAMCRRLVELGAKEQSVHYIPYFVDRTQFSRCFPEKQPPTFLAVGRLVEKKAPILTITAFERVLSAIPNAKLEIVGSGPLLGPCQQLIKALNVSTNVVLHGSQSHEFVADAMQRARCFVQHSVRAQNGDSEGTPLSILEAQASGLPVVATSHAGIADVVEHKKTGFLVNECDVFSMANHMIEIGSDANLTQRLGEQARERIDRNFNYDHTLRKLEQTIENAIASK
jgi:glycosyltransferase involved in cell wall biosynthesis